MYYVQFEISLNSRNPLAIRIGNFKSRALMFKVMLSLSTLILKLVPSLYQAAFVFYLVYKLTTVR